MIFSVQVGCSSLYTRILSNQSIDFGILRTLLEAGIVENRLWNCLVETIDRLWNFMDAARRWNCRKSTLELSSMPMAKTAKRKVNRMILESSDGCVLVVKKCTCHCICANSKGAHFKIDGDIEHIISIITSLQVTSKG